MIFLLDANVLIDANRDYYPIKRVPEFWGWLVYFGKTGNIKIPLEIYEELRNGNDDLAEWAKLSEIKDALLFDEEAEISLVRKVLDEGYANDLSDVDVEKLGRDPFLIAYALNDINNRSVVTTEVSSTGKKRANRRIPDVCKSFDISCYHVFEFLKILNFGTDWEKSI